MNYAIIKDNTVINTIICESDTAAAGLFPEYTVINIDGVTVGIGWAYNNSEFTEPVINKTPAEIAAENMDTAQLEYDRATLMINALDEQIQDEDYSGGTEEGLKSELAAWTGYRKELRGYIKSGDGSKRLPLAPVVT